MAIRSPHIRGHLLLFDNVPQPSYSATAGGRLLLAVLLLEFLLSPYFLFRAVQIPVPPLLPYVVIRLALVLALVRCFAGLQLSAIGLRAWRDWATTERSYLVQVVLIANVVFPLALSASLERALAEYGLISVLLIGFLPYVVYGFYQEVVYRGLLQTELVRRWGAVGGILASNILFTFGPLHYNAYATGGLGAFTSIFAFGLFVALIFKQSRNLWLIAVMHGIGNAYIVVGAGFLGS